jgi:hypothetical protein
MMRILSVLVALAVQASAQTAPARMPYTAIQTPEFVIAAEATFLQDDDILLGVASGNVSKAYPAADLAQHGAVSDVVPGGPISVTWCGVCNTGLVFRAEVKGRRLHFQHDRMVGANEVQKDFETGTSWQQATGEAIDGPLKGTRLQLYPAVRTTWAEWRKRFPTMNASVVCRFWLFTNPRPTPPPHSTRAPRGRPSGFRRRTAMPAHLSISTRTRRGTRMDCRSMVL